jgi:DNA modification methylase
VTKVEDGSIESFRPQRRNLNKHSQRGMGALEASMRKHGYVAPMTAAADGEIIDGSARLETVANVFEDDVLIVHHDGTKPVVMVRDDIPNASTNEARAISALANRIAEINLTWDAEELFADYQSEVDFGGAFNQEELDAIFAGLVAPEPVNDPGADVSKADELQKKWQTQTGQMWQLGAHRLICGDCTDKATVERLMVGEKAAFCMTDPPYGANYTGGTKKWKMLNGDETSELYAPALDIIRAYTEPKAPLYLFFSDDYLEVISSALKKAKYDIRAQLIWNKNHAQFGAMGAQYKQKHEPLFYAFKHGESPYWFGPNNEITVWDIDRANANEFHPTEKPVEIYARALGNSSSKGAIVFEPFSGSGACIIACEQLNRQCRAIELDAGYVAITLQRFQDSTGIEPVLINEG